jgi:hypothetical protein
MFAAPALKQFVREETLPGSQVQSDDELLDLIVGALVLVEVTAGITEAASRPP